jgi:hypothetical protein
MVRLLRRLVLMSLLAGGITLAVRRRRGQVSAPSTPTPTRAPGAAPGRSPSATWPPITTDDDQPLTADDATAGRNAADRTNDLRPAPHWTAPVDGHCPDGYPIKANDNSRIFHVPGGRFYERTVPERCYARAEDAQADGYRAAKA